MYCTLNPAMTSSVSLLTDVVVLCYSKRHWSTHLLAFTLLLLQENSKSVTYCQIPWSNCSLTANVWLLSVPVTIDSIHEVCEGKKSEMFRRYADNRFDPNCCFSIYFGRRVKSLDLVSNNAEEVRTWVTGLKYLMAGISDEDSLARRQRTRDQYPFLIVPVLCVGSWSYSTIELISTLWKLSKVCWMNISKYDRNSSKNAAKKIMFRLFF